MSNRSDFRRKLERELPRHPHEEAVLELVFNDEEEALCDADFVLNHQRQMPAIQEFLDEMSNIDSSGPCSRFH